MPSWHQPLHIPEWSHQGNTYSFCEDHLLWYSHTVLMSFQALQGAPAPSPEGRSHCCLLLFSLQYQAESSLQDPFRQSTGCWSHPPGSLLQDLFLTSQIPAWSCKRSPLRRILRGYGSWWYNSRYICLLSEVPSWYPRERLRSRWLHTQDRMHGHAPYMLWSLLLSIPRLLPYNQVSPSTRSSPGSGGSVLIWSDHCLRRTSGMSFS